MHLSKMFADNSKYVLTVRVQDMLIVKKVMFHLPKVIYFFSNSFLKKKILSLIYR